RTARPLPCNASTARWAESRLISAQTTFAPSWARRNAVAEPMPPPPPVTMATFPDKRCITVLHLLLLDAQRKNIFFMGRQNRRIGEWTGLPRPLSPCLGGQR